MTDIKALREEHRTLLQRREALQQDRSIAITRRDALQEQIPQLAAELTELQQQVDVVSAKITDARKRHEYQVEQAEKIDEQDRQAEARISEIEPLLATTQPATGTPVDKNNLAQHAARFGEFSAKDLAAVAKITPQAATKWIKQQIEAGGIKATGRKVMGQPMYQHLGAVQEVQEEASASLHDVRDWVVKQKDKFDRITITTATEVEGNELTDILQKLIQQGTIDYVGFDDLELYEYVKPTDMGIAARKDAERHKQLAKTPDLGRSMPVDGTGQQEKITDPDVRALISAIRSAGGSVTRATNSHYECTAPDSKKRVLIASTPSSRRTVLNDRSRVRRELGLPI